ncbi:hypothetical protein L3Q82_009238, partial [Scortum barcoo]
MIERSQLRWLGHLFRMPPGRLPREVFQACPTGRRPRGRPRTRWRDYVSRLAWERLGVPPEELEEVSGYRSTRDVFPTQPSPSSTTLKEYVFPPAPPAAMAGCRLAEVLGVKNKRHQASAAKANPSELKSFAAHITENIKLKQKHPDSISGSDSDRYPPTGG